MTTELPTYHSCDERPLPGVRAFVRRHAMTTGRIPEHVLTWAGEVRRERGRRG